MDIVNESFSLIRKHKEFYLKAILFILFVEIAFNLILPIDPNNINMLGIIGFSLQFFVEAMISWVLIVYIYGIISNNLLKLNLCIHIVSERFWILLVTAILTAIAVTIGFLFFILPGILLLLMFGFNIHSILIEDNVIFESFQYSKELTKGQRWDIFVSLFYTIIIFFLLIFPIDYIDNGQFRLYIELLINSFSTLFGTTVLTLWYYRLKLLKFPSDPI